MAAWLDLSGGGGGGGGRSSESCTVNCPTYRTQRENEYGMDDLRRYAREYDW